MLFIKFFLLIFWVNVLIKVDFFELLGFMIVSIFLFLVFLDMFCNKFFVIGIFFWVGFILILFLCCEK